MTPMPTPNNQGEEYVSAAFRPENVALHGNQEEVQKIVAAGPRGAAALAGLAVAVLLALWVCFFVFVFLPRGTVG